jgi:cytochrome c oxidase subunit II
MKNTTMIAKHRRAFLASAVATAFAGVAVVAMAAPKVRTIKVVAKKWDFVPNVIKVKKGENVVLKFTAPEVPMGFNLPDFNVRTDIIPGKVATVKLTPDKMGNFTFLCDIFCGEGHETMSGQLVVS